MSTLILDTTTKTIKVAMSGAAATTNPDFTVSYADNNGTTFTEGAGDGALSGATDVTVVAAPAAGYRRIIKGIFIENKDTAPITITVKYDNTGTQRTIVKVTLQIGDTWSTDGTFDTYGALKQTLGTINLSSVTGTLAVANGGTGVTASTGSGSVVLSSSPILVTPTLGIPSSITLTNATGLPLTTGITGILAVANGGSGVATSSGASSNVLRDANSNIVFNNSVPGYTTITTAAGTTTLTVASTYQQRFTGTTTQTIVLPSATTMALGQGFIIDNDSTGNLTLQDGSAGALGIVVPGMAAYVFCEVNGTTAGSWSGYMFVPGGGPSGQVTWGTAGLNLAGQTISSSVLSNPTVTNYVETAYVANTSTAITIALTNGTVQILTLTASSTITMPTAVVGKSFIIILRQDATGSRTVTWSTVNWAGGTAPTVTSTASKQDIFSFFSDGTSWYGITVGQNFTQ